MRFYIASHYKNKELVVDLSKKLFAVGIGTTQTWPTMPGDTEIIKADVAAIDLSEIDAADGVIVLTENCERVSGGMHFEAGYGLGTGKAVLQVGPQVNIFYHLKNIRHFEAIEELLGYLS